MSKLKRYVFVSGEHGFIYYLADKVDALLAEKDAEIAALNADNCRLSDNFVELECKYEAEKLPSIVSK